MPRTTLRTGDALPVVPGLHDRWSAADNFERRIRLEARQRHTEREAAAARQDVQPVQPLAAVVEAGHVLDGRVNQDSEVAETEEVASRRDGSEPADVEQHVPVASVPSAYTGGGCSGRGKGSRGLGKGGAKRHRKILRDVCNPIENTPAPSSPPPRLECIHA